MEETWRPVAGYSGLYEISSTGRVKSLRRVVCKGYENRARQVVEESVLKGSWIGGQLRFAAYDNTPGATKRARNNRVAIARAVWEAFVGDLPKGSVMLFADEDPLNCALANLGWMPRAQQLQKNMGRIPDPAAITWAQNAKGTRFVAGNLI